MTEDQAQREPKSLPEHLHDDPAAVDSAESAPVYLVGIGASAGGLEALEQFFSRMPADTGMAFIVIQHLSPDFKSLMSELLSRHTDMPIYRVRDGMKVEANSVFLLPPKKEMVISDGRFVLTDKDPQQPLTLPIDIFFRSLAQDAREKAIGIILSGTGSDGSRGVRSIHESGGLILVQDERSAKFDGMPRSAIATGCADLVLSPESMPEALLKYARHPLSRPLRLRPRSSPQDPEADPMSRLIAMLVAAYGIDFSHYKTTTVARRVERRLLLRQIPGIEEYSEELQNNPAELDALYRDLLIGVTRFFRDPEAFAILEDRVIERLASKQVIEEGLRIWVAGCATGEEAYSVAILLHEKLTAMELPAHFKIFATDAHRESLEFASAGVYSESSLGDVQPARVERYFTRTDGGYRISPEIRRSVVFAPQNILKDPPFTKIDLLCCRNLLIYFRPAAQRKVLSLFHFALNTGGFLFLGPSESVGDLHDEFDTIDQHWRILQKRRDVRQPPSLGLSLPSRLDVLRPAGAGAARPAPPSTDLRLLRAYDALLDRFVPPSLLVNDRLEVVHTFGEAGKYMRQPGGRATLDAVQLVHEDLRIALSTGLQRAAKERQAVSYQGVRARMGESEELVRLTVEPLPDRYGDSLFLFVTFEAVQTAPATQPEAHEFQPEDQVRQHLADVEQELQYTREHLSATIEELETSNEELQATNEELVASNEELQSTNEELHSVNEELYTVNAEYQNKIDELTQLTNDMDNLLSSTDIGTVFLDTQFRIRKITPAVSASFNLLPQDVGRPIEHISSNLEYSSLMEDLVTVRETGRRLEREVRNRTGAWLLMRVLPYRTEISAVEGLVITFTDITAIRRAQQDLRQSEANFRQLADFVNAIFWLTSPDLRMIIYVSPAYEKLWKRSLESLCQNPVSWMQAIHPDDLAWLETKLNTRDPAEEWEAVFRVVLPDGSIRWIRDRRYPVFDAKGAVIRMAGISVDITESKLSHERLELTQFVVDNAGDMVLWSGPSGRIVYANRSACEFFGNSNGPLLDRPVGDLGILPLGESWGSVSARLLEEGQFGWEAAVSRRDGDPVPLDVGFKCLRFENETYFFSILRDVSQLKTSERELARYAAELERANESLRQHNRELDEFAHLASHDLKEPLRAIMTFSQLLSHDLGGQMPSEAVRDLEFITGAASRMQRLVTDLLALSRTGRGDMRREAVSLRQCVESALEALAVGLKETAAIIDLGELPSVRGDRTMLTQLFQNLLSNALKFTGSNHPEVKIRARRDGDFWLVSVVDNGLGVRPEYMEKIFQPFRRVHVKPGQEGTGIGLAICRKVVERHGGQIWVESEPGTGATFLFTLPAGDGQQE